ncbi:maltase A1-like [Uranotaenia lowii]|uniref:maltase A1-like n=1 Tax=Uranotaenia lowii TaxID=190385 RepID=UPI002479816A|nr:maltase A1-like [Uranotaenia lowii]
MNGDGLCKSVATLLLLLMQLHGSAFSENLRQLTATDWWQRAGFYQIYPRSYKDSNGDGIGDLKGITEKLSYIKDVGMHAVWLSPIYKSPMADFGYDISDFRDIHPDYGTMADFEAMVKKAKEVGLKVILDFVPNHSSDEHEWFVKSEDRVDPYTDYYVWHDGKPGSGSINDPPNNWAEAFRGSAWKYSEKRKQYYLHQYHVKQPDLNYRNPLVVEEMKNVLRFWLEKGVDGFRVDAVPNLFEDELFRDEPPSGNSDDPLRPEYYVHIYTTDLPETVDMVYQWRKVMEDFKTKNGGDTRVLMTESWSALSVVKTFFEDVNKRQGSNIPFNFQFIMHLNNASKAADFKTVIDSWLNTVPEGHTPNWVLGNHDVRRIASRMGGEHMADIMAMLEMTLPGVSITYQGEEIGMLDHELTWEQTLDPQACQTSPEVYQKFNRDPARTPFQWDTTANAGFTNGSSTWLPVNPNYVTVNVKTEQAASKSHLKVYQELMKLRKEDAFQSYSYGIQALGNVVAILRIHCQQALITLANIGSTEAQVNASSLFTTYQVTPLSGFKVRLSSVNSKRSNGDSVAMDKVVLQPYEAILLQSGVTRHLTRFVLIMILAMCSILA